MTATKNLFEINGKVLIFSDLHIGLKDSSSQYLGICINVVKEIISTIKKQGIQTVIFCGDLFHYRKQVELRALNCGLKLISALAKYAKVYLICGNHDTYYKSSNEINSINIFKDTPNVVLVSKTTSVKINGKSALLVPWGEDVSGKRRESYDMLLGHFDISSEYLINSYIEEHSPKTQKTTTELAKELGLEETSYNDRIGDFVDVVKKEGDVYCGHIHVRKEFIAKSRNIIFVGSPYQQNAGEVESVCGYYVLDENNERKFYKTKSSPKHILLKVSDILEKGIDKYDFTKLKGNIVKKIYDVQIGKDEETLINQKINLSDPFDELNPEHDVVSTTENADSVITSETLEMIKKSKLDYIQTYINNLDSDSLQKMGLEKDRIFELMKNYYERLSK